MKNFEIILTSLIVFFLFFISNALAYTDFSYNPFFNNDITGVIFYNYPLNNSYAYVPNLTFASETGILEIYNNGLANYLEVWLIKDWESYFSTIQYYSDIGTFINSTPYNKTSILIPKNQEILISFKYRINNTLTTPMPMFNYHNGTKLTSIPLSTSTNVFNNFSLVIPSENIDRNFHFYISLSFDNLNTSIRIDKLKVYTLDVLETRPLWTTNKTLEFIRYCGVGSVNFGTPNVDNDVFYLSDPIGYLVAKDTENYVCWAIKTGNLTIARRQLSTSGTGLCNFLPTHNLRDAYVQTIVSSCSGGNDATFSLISLITRMSLTGIEYTNIVNITNAILLDTDGTPTTRYNITKMLNTEGKRVKSYYNLLPYANTSSPAGSNWRLWVGSDAYKPFFLSSFVCDPKLVCDVATNYQYFQTINCEYVNPLWCGEWLCKTDLSGCDFGFIGSYCLYDNYSYVSTTQNGTLSYGNCYPKYCYNKTLTTTECLTEAQYQTRLLTDKNPVEATGEALAEFMGIDIQFGMMILSVIISFLAGFMVLKADKKNTGWGIKGFAITFIMLILTFTFIGWFPYWLILIFVSVVGLGFFYIWKGSKEG